MRSIVAGGALIIFTAVLVMVAIDLHDFGEPTHSQMDDYFIKNAQNETGSNNVVASVVFDYRGFDTLGEATVLFTAVAGTTAIFKKKKEENK